MKNRETILQTAILLVIALLSFAAFRLGFYVANRSSDGREPAALPPTYASSSPQLDLHSTVREQLAKGTQVVTANGSIGLELGQFTVPEESGQELLACEIYDQVEIVFHSNDMAVGGEPSEMSVVGPCEPTSDKKGIAPVMVPYDKVMSLPVKDMEFSPSLEAATAESTRVQFRNVSDAWPRSWGVHSVRFHREEADDIEISGEDFRQVLGKTPILEWGH